MTEIIVQATCRTCYCQGMNTTVGVECVGCHGTARLHQITYGIRPPLPQVSLGKIARFRRRVGLDHPIELQEWLRDMERSFDERNRHYDNLITEAQKKHDQIEMMLYGNPANGKTYGVKAP